MHLPEKTLLQGGKYKIVRFISSGGFGCTYEALHVMLDKRVAIKEFFVKDFCNRDETTAHVTVGTLSRKGLVTKLRRKFIDEAKALGRLDHRGIVRVSDVFEENGTAYFVMDYIDGRSLGDIISEKGSLSEAVALRYIRQAADALRCVHNHNRLHLDIKPGNIMIDESDNAVLIDFGASKQYDEEQGENTSTLMGKTPGYAPIEQMGNNVMTFMPATDIYALGATLYKMLTGTTPLGADLLASGETLEPLPAGISASTAQAIGEAMKISKKQRPQSIDAFLSILDGNEEQKSVDDDVTIIDDIKPKPTTKEQPTPLEPKVIKTEPRPKTEPKSKSKNAKLSTTEKIAVLAVVVVIAVVMSVTISKTSSNTSDEDLTEIVAQESSNYVTDMSYTNSKGVTFTYTGEVDANDVPDGKGKGVYQYGTYEGDYVNGLRHGKAIYNTKDGTNHYEGTYVNDEYGIGKLVFNNDGSYFEGTFKNNEMYDGTYHDSNGTTIAVSP